MSYRHILTQERFVMIILRILIRTLEDSALYRIEGAVL